MTLMLCKSPEDSILGPRDWDDEAPQTTHECTKVEFMKLWVRRNHQKKGFP